MPVRVLAHIKRLDGCFGQFLVRVICDCGACREIEPENHRWAASGSNVLEKVGTIDARDNCSGVTR